MSFAPVWPRRDQAECRLMGESCPLQALAPPACLRLPADSIGIVMVQHTPSGSNRAASSPPSSCVMACRNRREPKPGLGWAGREGPPGSHPSMIRSPSPCSPETCQSTCTWPVSNERAPYRRRRSWAHGTPCRGRRPVGAATPRAGILRGSETIDPAGCRKRPAL